VSIPDFSLITPEAYFRSRRRGWAGIRLWFYFMRYQSESVEGETSQQNSSTAPEF